MRRDAAEIMVKAYVEESVRLGRDRKVAEAEVVGRYTEETTENSDLARTSGIETQSARVVVHLTFGRMLSCHLGENVDEDLIKEQGRRLAATIHKVQEVSK